MRFCGHAVDAKGLGICCCWICCWGILWVHGCEVEAGGPVAFSDHANVVGGWIYDDDAVLVKVDVVAGVAKLTNRDKQLIREVLVAVGFLGVVG